MSDLGKEARVLDWVGGLPGRWEIGALGTHLRQNRSNNRGMKESRVLSLSFGRVVVKPEEKLRGLVPESFETYQVLEPGDIVIRPTDLQNDRRSLRVGQTWRSGIITSAYIAIRPQPGFDSRYAAYLLSAYDFMKVFYGFGSGLRQNLDFRHLKRIPIPIPPQVEQQLIVRFLDHAELRVARAIAAKSALFAMLNEAKRAVVSELVLGDSDNRISTAVPGLESLPSHWRWLRAKHVWKPVDVRSVRGSEERLSVSSARGVVPRSSTSVTMFQAASYVGHKVVQPGNLVINSLWAWGRGLGVSQYFGLVSPVYGVYELVDKESDVAYLDHLLRSNAYQWQFQVRSKGIWKSRLSLSDDAFLDMPILLPPLEEQRSISARISERTAAIETAITAVEREIVLLKEYRIRLISDVVTGKMDVTKEAAELPDIDPVELAEALAGVTAGSSDEVEDADGGDDEDE